MEWARGKSTAWGRTDGYCHTLQWRPERCAVRLLQESTDEGQLPVWQSLQEETTLIAMQVWRTGWLSAAAHMLAHCIPNTVYIPRNINESVHAGTLGSNQASPYMNNRNHVSQWVIWWDLCPIFYYKEWRGLLPGAARLSKYIIFTPFIPSRAYACVFCRLLSLGCFS